MIRLTLAAFLLLLSLVFSPQNASAKEQKTEELLKKIRAVDARGKGHQSASLAMEQLVQQDGNALLKILHAFKGANPLAINWLRSAFETIAERTFKEKGIFPNAPLKKFFFETKNNPHARRLAYEWIQRIEPSFGKQVLPRMLHDPSVEMRRDAVTMLSKQAKGLKKKGKKREAKKLYKKALTGAFDEDQVKSIAKGLKQLGETINMQQHYGFISQWNMIGPFNNKNKIGFVSVYPPEKKIALTKKHKGQLGEVQWKKLSTKDPFGVMDIHTLYKNYKGSVMYATTEFYSKENQNVELRIGTSNAWKVWVNGKELFAHEEYHRGMKIDQYQVAAKFNAGKNIILLKICQNEQDQSWAQKYRFQLRVCKNTGIAIHSDKK